MVEYIIIYKGAGILLGKGAQMDTELAQKIVKEITRFSAKKYALTDEHGEVLAKTTDFSILHNPLDRKSKRSLPLLFEKRRIGYLYIDENLHTTNEVGPILKSLAELIVHQNFFTRFLTTDEKRIDQLIFELLKDEEADRKDIEQALYSFGINLMKKRLAIVIEIDSSSYFYFNNENVETGEREEKIARVKRVLKNFLSSFYTHHQDNIVAYLGGSRFIILKDMGNEPNEYQTEFRKTLNSLFFNLSEELRTKITIGVGEYKGKIEGLKESFDEAASALKFGKQNWGVGRIYHFDSFGVVAPLFSGATQENITVSKDIVKKLKKHPELAESLNAYFEHDISLSKTSKKLKIHRNTLVYRLEKIAEITELDPRVFNDAFQLKLALVLDKYSKDKNE